MVEPKFPCWGKAFKGMLYDERYEDVEGYWKEYIYGQRFWITGEGEEGHYMARKTEFQGDEERMIVKTDVWFECWAWAKHDFTFGKGVTVEYKAGQQFFVVEPSGDTHYWAKIEDSEDVPQQMIDKEELTFVKPTPSLSKGS